MKDEVIGRIVACGVIPVIRVPSADLAMRAVEAVVSGGIDVIEVTMTVPGAVSLIESLARRFAGGEVIVGAGTVVDAETARTCILSGAAFVVSPIVDERTIECCRTRGVPVLPGALTPTEIMHAVRAGADLVKVFPCGAMGGANYVRSILAPLPHLRLVPTGGVSVQTVGDFIRAGASAVGVGADLIDIGKLGDEGAAAIVDRARQYAQAIRLAREPKGVA